VLAATWSAPTSSISTDAAYLRKTRSTSCRRRTSCRPGEGRRLPAPDHADGLLHGYIPRAAPRRRKATTNAVVSASILILTFNYFITEAFFAR